MNLTPSRWRRNPRRAAQNAYFAIDENPAADAARDTLRSSGDPAARLAALDTLADREWDLHLHHDAAFGHQAWDDDLAGDAATGLAFGAMALRLLAAAEWARAAGHEGWASRRGHAGWSRDDLKATEQALTDACAELLDRLSAEDDPTEAAVLYTRLWIAAYPVIGGQAAEWIAVLGNDWQCRAAGVQDGPDTVLVLPDAGACGVQYFPNTNPDPA